MHFLVLLWVTHFVNMPRYVSLSKDRVFKALYGNGEQARAAAEPGDQGCYGLDSRSARFMINNVMWIGIMCCTLSPRIALLTFIKFACCGRVYGYLSPFAETKKADTGGNPQRLRHRPCR